MNWDEWNEWMFRQTKAWLFAIYVGIIGLSIGTCMFVYDCNKENKQTKECYMQEEKTESCKFLLHKKGLLLAKLVIETTDKKIIKIEQIDSKHLEEIISKLKEELKIL